MCMCLSERFLMREMLSNTFLRGLNSTMSEISIVVELVDYFAVNLTLPTCVTKGSRPSSMANDFFVLFVCFQREKFTENLVHIALKTEKKS